MAAPSIASRFAFLGLGAAARFRRWARTVGYGHVATLGEGTRLMETADIQNPSRDRGLVVVGAHCIVGGALVLFGHGGRIRIGDWCFVGSGSRIWSAESIDIGSRVLISHGVNIHDSDSHPRTPEARHRQFVSIATQGHPKQIEGIASSPVRVGDDAWIGFNATILKGVSIGARSIVAAGSIVTQDVPPDHLFVAGKLRMIES